MTFISPSFEAMAAAIAYEPCLEFAPDAAEPGICDGCGWLEDEHSPAEVPAAA